MEGNVVTAAKWLGSLMVLASLILVGGMRWVLGSLEWDRPGESIPGQAAKAGPLPGDLEALAKSFHDSGPATTANPTATVPPRSLFADPPADSAPVPGQP